MYQPTDSQLGTKIDKGSQTRKGVLSSHLPLWFLEITHPGTPWPLVQDTHLHTTPFERQGLGLHAPTPSYQWLRILGSRENSPSLQLCHPVAEESPQAVKGKCLHLGGWAVFPDALKVKECGQDINVCSKGELLPFPRRDLTWPLDLKHIYPFSWHLFPHLKWGVRVLDEGALEGN